MKERTKERMKGIMVWIWIIAGIIIAFILFTVFIQLMGFITMSREKEDAKQNFGNLANAADSLCDSTSGMATNSQYVFPGSVSIIYSTSDQKTYAFSVGSNSRTYGNYVCMIQANETTCQRVRCKVEMDPIMSQNNVLSLVDTILGKSSYHQYFLREIKTACGVSVLFAGENFTNYCQ